MSEHARLHTINAYRARIADILKTDFTWHDLTHDGLDDATGKGPSAYLQLRIPKSTPYVPYEVAASFSLYQLIGCCGVCVSTGAYVSSDYRQKGLGTLLNSMRIDLARALGYGCLMCTDIATNEAQSRILQKNGWTLIHGFTNPRTTHQVGIHIINLYDKAE